MAFIRKHKIVIALSAIFIVVLLAIIIILSSVLSEDENDKYGSRIDGIENFKITNSRVDNIRGKVLENQNINKITFRLDGKLIKFFIEVKKDAGELNVESILNIIIDDFTEEEKQFYDFQVYITCEEKKESYPMIAYKHNNNQVFTITKKEGSKDEE